MNIKEFLPRVAGVVFILLLPVVLILTDVQVIAFDRSYYTAEYIKYGIPKALGMEMGELEQATEKLLQYLDNKREDLNFKSVVKGQPVEFFSPRDKQHMVDVKGLFTAGRYIRNAAAAFIAVFAFWLLRRKEGSGLSRLTGLGTAAAVAGFVPIFLLIILMNLDFYKYFTLFHLIFFKNDLWLLDPAQDRLINMFPQDIFTDMAFRISYFYMAELVLILAVCGVYRYSAARRRKKDRIIRDH